MIAHFHTPLRDLKEFRNASGVQGRLSPLLRLVAPFELKYTAIGICC
jgi:hypothetical protein